MGAKGGVRGVRAHEDVPEDDLEIGPSFLYLLGEEILVPFSISLAAFLVFPTFCEALHSLALLVNESAAGYMMAGKVISSTITPVIGICFATLTATTLNTLRNRQQGIRTGLTQEAVFLDTVVAPVVKICRFRPHRVRRALILLEAYAETVYLETSRGLPLEERKEKLVVQKQQMLALLQITGEVDYDLVAEGKSVNDAVIFGRVVGYAQGIVNHVHDIRSQRRSTLLSAFPPIHWAILLLLAACMPTSYLLIVTSAAGEGSGGLSTLAYDDTLVRTLFTLLVGIEAAILSLLLDLNDPYSGFFSVQEGKMFKACADRIRAKLEEVETEKGDHIVKAVAEMRELSLERPLAVSQYPQPTPAETPGSRF